MVKSHDVPSLVRELRLRDIRCMPLTTQCSRPDVVDLQRVDRHRSTSTHTDAFKVSSRCLRSFNDETRTPPSHSKDLMAGSAAAKPSKKSRHRREALAVRRKAVGWSQENLAFHIGVHSRTIYRWEVGTSTPGPSVRDALAQALQMSVLELEELLSAPNQNAPDKTSQNQTR